MSRVRQWYLLACRWYARTVVGDNRADWIFRAMASPFFYRVHGYWPRFSEPRSFSEKIWHRMLFSRDPRWTQFSDKWRVREYVASRVGERYLIPHLWHGVDPESIPFDELPVSFVIKTTHGCAYNVIVPDKSQLDRAGTLLQLRHWLTEDYGSGVYVGVQWAYRHINPTILIERLLSDYGSTPTDYKFFCYGGHVEFVQVDRGRYSQAHTKTFYTREFTRLEFHCEKDLYAGTDVRPGCYDEMVCLAEKLSAEFDFLRVDLYNVEGRVYFGELTVYPGGGCSRFSPTDYDRLFGSKWKISKKNTDSNRSNDQHSRGIPKLSPVNIKNNLKRSMRLRQAVWRLREGFNACLYNLSPEALVRLRYKSLRGRWPDLKSPQTYDEKLCWLNLYWLHPLKARCGDKYGVRSYVQERGLRRLLPELFGAYDNPQEINFEVLPVRFVLKCTHGCKCNIFCLDKKQLDVAGVTRQLGRWMKKDYSKVYGELHYAGMTPRIICEPYFGDSRGTLPLDYKVHCFGGKAHCTEVCSDRGLDGHLAKYDFFGPGWANLASYNEPGLHSNRSIRKPEPYEEMIAAAEELSQPFPYVRVDFYVVSGRVFLGEMTFTPAGCIDCDLSEIAQRVLGSLIELPEKRLKW